MISAAFISLFLTSAPAAENSLEIFYDFIPNTMNFIAGSPSGEHPIELDYNLGEMTGKENYGEGSPFVLERYALVNSKLNIGGKDIPLLCTVLFATKDKKDDEEFYYLDYSFMTDVESCSGVKVSIKSSSSINLRLSSHSPELNSGAQVIYHRNSFWAEKVSPKRLKN